ELEIDLLGVKFRIVAIGFIEEARVRAPGAISDPVQCARAAHELQDLVADPVHVDGERDAAEANERNAQFLLAQGSTPKGPFPKPSTILATELWESAGYRSPLFPDAEPRFKDGGTASPAPGRQPKPVSRHEHI